MLDLARLGIEVDSKPVAKASDELDNFSRAGGKASGAADTVTSSTDRMSRGMKVAAGAAAKMAAGLIAALGSGALFSGAIREAEQLERNLFRTNAIIAATGQAAGRSAAQLHEQARAIARATLQSTEGVMRAQQTMLTFRKVQGDVFDAAIKSATDMSAALGTDLNSSILQLGKALEDPITGMSALSRSGTVFTEAQKAMVKEMVATGNIMAAQKFILAELAAQYGGVAAKEAAGLAGAQDSLAQSTQEFLIQLSNSLGLMSAATALYNKLAGAVDWAAGQIDRVKFYIGAAVAALTVAFAPAIAAATVAVGGFVASLVLTRTALMRTGIGLIVVAAGELAYWFNKLVIATGGWAAALQALGDLASGVWEGIKTSAASIAPALGAVWERVKSGFFSALQSMMEAWGRFLGSMAEKVDGVPFFGAMTDALREASGNAAGAMAEYEAKATAASAASANLNKEASGLAEQGWAKVMSALKTLQLQMDAANGELDGGKKAADELKKALDGVADGAVGGSAGGAAGGVAKVSEEAEKLKEQLEGPLSGAIDNLGNAFGEFLTGGIRTFKDFAKSIIDGFKRMISQMIATAVANPIKLALGIGGSVAGGAAAAGTAGGGGNGLLGGLLGGKLFGGGGMIPGIWGGLKGIFTGGGLGSSFANLGGLVTGTSSGFGALGAALPALGIVAGGIALLVNGLSKKYNGRAVRGALTPEGFDGTEFDFWNGGFLRGDSVEYMDVRTEIQKELDDTAIAIRTSVKDMAKALGAGSAAIDGFVGEQFTIWLTGPAAGDQAEIAAQLEAELTKLGDGMAGLIPGLSKFQREGEGAYDALVRLGEGILAVNDAADILGHRVWDISLASGDAASELVELFGGLESMTAAVGVYWQAFYTDAERAETTIRRLRQTFADLGQVMPESRDQYRAMVEAIDTTTDAGRKLYAEMIGLAGALDQVLPEVAEFTIAMQGIISQIGGEIGSQIDIARDMAADAKASAQLWYRTANTLREFLRDLTNSPLTLASPAQQFAVNRSRFNTAFDLVKGGDVDAAQDMPGLAKNYLESLKASSSSALEYRREAAKVTAALQLAAGIADIEGSNDDILRALYEKQIEVLTNLGHFLKLDGIDADMLKSFDKETRKLIKDFDGTVGSYEKVLKQLGKAIADAKDFSYDKLLADLDINLKFAKTSDMPDWVKSLVKDSGDKIKINLDFILRRDDLTPDMKWIATNSLSQHVKNLKFILKQDLDDQTRAIALATSSGLLRTLNLVVGKDLDPDTKRLALMANSDLTRTVGAVLAKKMDPQARKLALAGVGAYDVAVRAALSWPDISKKTRQLVFQDGSGYAVMVTAALDLDKKQRRILLDQLGDYAVNVTASLAMDVGLGMQRLLLKANTTAIRGITIATIFADDIDPEIRDELYKQSSRALRTISGIVNPIQADALGLLFLDQLAAGVGSVYRKISGGVMVGRLSWTNEKFLHQLTAGPGTVYRKISGGVMVGDLSWTNEKFLQQLVAGAGTVSRKVSGGVMVGDLSWTNEKFLQQLVAGAGTVSRKIAGGVTVGDLGWTKERYLWEIFAGAGSVFRGISGGVDTAGIVGIGQDYMGQLFAGTGNVLRKILGGVMVGSLTWTNEKFFHQLIAGAGTVSRKIAGGVMTGDLTWTNEKFLLQLIAGAGTVSRKITGGVDTSKIAGLGAEYLGQLLFGDGSVSRSVKGGVFTGNLTWTNEKFLHQLVAGDGFIARAINGGVNVGDLTWTNEKYLQQLAAGKGTTWRAIAGGVSTGKLSWTNEKYLHQIVAGDGFIMRTITGGVDLGALDDRQLALLDAIKGADAGKLTVYGGFKFEPSEAFAAWFEGSFTAIATPMDALAAGLAELRAAVVGQTEATERAAIVAALDREAGKMLRNASGQYVATQAQVEKLARMAGVSLSGNARKQAYRVKSLSATDLLDDIYVDMSGYQTKLLLEARVGTAGLRVDPAGYLAAYPGVGTNFSGTPQEHFERHGRAEILFGNRTFEPSAFDWSSIGLDIPGFAGGGLHSGGLRMVGERGPELEVTGPSRIISNSDTRSMLDNRDVVRELAEMRRELAGMRDEQRQLGLAEVKHGKRTADAITKWDKIGMPETQT